MGRLLHGGVDRNTDAATPCRAANTSPAALGAGRDASQFALSRRVYPTNTVGGFIASKFAAERSRYKARRLLPAGFLRTASQTAEAGIVPPNWDDPSTPREGVPGSLRLTGNCSTVARWLFERRVATT